MCQLLNSQEEGCSWRLNGSNQVQLFSFKFWGGSMSEAYMCPWLGGGQMHCLTETSPGPCDQGRSLGPGGEVGVPGHVALSLSDPGAHTAGTSLLPCIPCSEASGF